MHKGIKTILFATKLNQESMAAFNLAAKLALQFQARLIILHVIEKIPDNIESHVKVFLGEKKWNAVRQGLENEAQQALIGKRSSGKLIRKALEHLCSEAGIDEASCGYQSREIVIGEGNVVDSIIEYSKEQACDLIIIGSHENHRLTKSIGATIKSVLRRSKKPVLVVPADPDAESDLPDESVLHK
jgi:nucleotide-binding universal stress UspA family protein